MEDSLKVRKHYGGFWEEGGGGGGVSKDEELHGNVSLYSCITPRIFVSK